MAKVFIEETTLSAIGDAIRTKTETTELINPADMAEKIEGISVGSAAVVEPLSITSNGTYNAPEGVDGYTPITVNVPQDGAPTAEELTLTGDCSYRFAQGGWNWFINKYGNQITTNNVRNVSYMFNNNYSLEYIPFEINTSVSSRTDITNMFYECRKLKNAPNVNNFIPSGMKYLFYNCEQLREIPDSFCDTWDWSEIENLTSNYVGDMSYMFYDCVSLRKIAQGLLSHGNPQNVNSYSIYYNGFSNCYVLDELPNLSVRDINKAQTANMFNNTFKYCYRLKKLTFKTNEDGTPIVNKWKNQSIDLSYNASPSTITYFINYNSGITRDKLVDSDATYQALKDDPDWFSLHYDYARYNKTSAIETINSLPDASAYLAENGGTNTIKFKGAAGGKTDGGAINTMTEEEIAVAAAKGWTVSFA